MSIVRTNLTWKHTSIHTGLHSKYGSSTLQILRPFRSHPRSWSRPNPPILRPPWRSQFRSGSNQTMTKPILFTVGVATVAFGTAALWHEHHRLSIYKRLRSWTRPWEPTVADAVRYRAQLARETLRHQLTKLKSWGVPDAVQSAWLSIGEKWISMRERDQTLAVLIAINTLVFAAWQVPRLQPFMQRWFTHHPSSNRLVTMLTSAFSHREMWHFAVNMMALWSFGGVVHDFLGREQFLAFYLTGATTSSLVSHLVSQSGRRQLVLPSLGASGALFGCLSACAVQHPEASVYIIFLPFIPIKIGVALPCLMALDVVGLLRGWQLFDHVAHLAGASFGIAYAYQDFGRRMIWNPLQEQLNEWRKQQQKRLQEEKSRRERWW
ncbi:uncharacterized protein VTP21DRAFT_1858 [Calcarisporiella thermophila]|uniref:uncharacterized protein n=1 Tax=Calcarisporiella thermophila TaxID=911321 RepID=UPI003744AFCC